MKEEKRGKERKGGEENACGNAVPLGGAGGEGKKENREKREGGPVTLLYITPQSPVGRKRGEKEKMFFHHSRGAGPCFAPEKKGGEKGEITVPSKL